MTPLKQPYKTLSSEVSESSIRLRLDGSCVNTSFLSLRIITSDSLKLQLVTSDDIEREVFCHSKVVFGIKSIFVSNNQLNSLRDQQCESAEYSVPRLFQPRMWWRCKAVRVFSREVTCQCRFLPIYVAGIRVAVRPTG